MAGGKISRECRTFETSTAGLEALLGWLTQSGCIHVAMEATGVYWKPVWNILSDGEFCDFADLEKWKQVEAKTLELMKLLGPEERRKVQIKFISNILLERVALSLLVVSILSLIIALLIGEQSVLFLFCVTCWLAATGALGANGLYLCQCSFHSSRPDCGYYIPDSRYYAANPRSTFRGDVGSAIRISGLS
jgi:hypothetical protein